MHFCMSYYATGVPCTESIFVSPLWLPNMLLCLRSIFIFVDLKLICADDTAVEKAMCLLYEALFFPPVIYLLLCVRTRQYKQETVNSDLLLVLVDTVPSCLCSAQGKSVKCSDELVPVVWFMRGQEAQRNVWLLCDKVHALKCFLILLCFYLVYTSHHRKGTTTSQFMKTFVQMNRKNFTEFPYLEYWACIETQQNFLGSAWFSGVTFSRTCLWLITSCVCDIRPNLNK